MKNLVGTGKCGTCIWKLDEKGTLLIAPEEGESGVLDGTDAWPWKAYDGKITALTVANVVYAPEDASGLFAHLPNLLTADISGLDLEKTQDISGMFEYCEKLNEIIGLGGLNTPGLKKADSVFAYCLSLPHVIGIEHWDIGNLESIRGMFCFCVSLTELDLSDWERGAELDMEDAFSECWSLARIDMGTWGHPDELGFKEHVPGKRAQARKEYARIAGKTEAETAVTLELVKNLREEKAHIEIAGHELAKRTHVIALTLSEAKELYAQLGKLLADGDILEALEN